MKKMKINLTELLSYKPGAETKKMILKEVRESGKSIEEVADKFSMPPLFQKDANGMIQYKGEKMTSEQFNEKFPHRRFVTIAGRDKTT
jgi:hypothetical protein